MIRVIALSAMLLVALASCGHGIGGKRGSEILPRKSFVFIKKFVKLKNALEIFVGKVNLHQLVLAL